MPTAPTISSETSADGVRVALGGEWTLSSGSRLEREAEALIAAVGQTRRALIDISGLGRLDTAGAWIIDRSRHDLAEKGVDATLQGVRDEHATLLREASYRPAPILPERAVTTPISLLADVGESVYESGQDTISGIAFLGRVVAAAVRSVFDPKRWRITSFVFHLEAFSLRSAPIVLMINFFVGAIVAQQGIFQLARFGASSFTVDLVGILTLRELGVLLTAIMVAGRSGSAITAEIGAMKQREEIDALRVMALDPMEVLILPRLTALIISLPILTFLGDLSALFGGMCVTWFYGDVNPTVFLSRLQEAYSIQRFAVGLIKAPFMALVIGVIAAAEGFAVGGSADSLGSKVTASVVKSIFMVIVLDGFFAMFFAAIRF